MIVVKAKARVRADKRDDAVAAAVAMQRDTRAEEGNISYTFAADLEDPNVFHLFEEWADQQSLTDHFATPHMATFVEALGAVIDGDMPTTKYEVASHGPL